MPTISCGGDSPIDKQSLQPPQQASQQQVQQPRRDRPSSGGNSKNTAFFDDQLKELSRRLSSATTKSNNNGSSARASAAAASSIVSVDSILRSGFVDPMKFLSKSEDDGNAGNRKTASEISQLAAELMQEFREIEQYHYNLDEEMREKQRVEEEIARKRSARAAAEMKRIKKRQQQQQSQSGASVRMVDDAKSVVSAAQTQMTGVSATSTVRLRREELYELPPEIANNGGAMKRRFDGCRATTGFTKMLSNRNLGQSAPIGSQPLLQQVPGSGAALASAAAATPPLTSVSIARAASISSSMSQQRSVVDANNQRHGLPNSSVNQPEESDDDDEEQEDEDNDFDDGAIVFCQCGKICEVQKQQQQGGGSKKSFVCRACGEQQQRQDQPIATASESVDIQCDPAGDSAVAVKPGAQGKQQQQQSLQLLAAGGEDDEAEQHRLFRLAVQEWRGGGGSAGDAGRQLQENDPAEAAAVPHDAPHHHDLRCPDPQRFMYFSALWDSVQKLSA